VPYPRTQQAKLPDYFFVRIYFSKITKNYFAFVFQVICLTLKDIQESYEPDDSTLKRLDDGR